MSPTLTPAETPTTPDAPDGGEALHDEPQGNGRHPRSETPYPFYDLGTAISIVEAVRRSGGSDARNADVMRELGVTKSSSRLWAYGIPAATQFGLVERDGRGDAGRIKVTDLAMRIVLPGTQDEARAAKVAAFRNPELYSKLVERFAGHPAPSKEGLKNILHRDYGILESMAPNAAEAFLESLTVAELVTTSGVIDVDAHSRRSAPAPDREVPPQDGRADGEGEQELRVPKDYIIYRCKLTKSLVIEIPLPPRFSAADARKLHAFLLTQVDDDDNPPAGGGLQ